MDANLFIQVIGVLYFIIGLAFLFNKKFYKSIFKDVLKSSLFMFFGGMFGVVIGLIIMFYYYELALTREGLITFVGFAALMKGITGLLFPEKFRKLVKAFSKPKYFDLITFFIIAVGIMLLYLGFLA